MPRCSIFCCEGCAKLEQNLVGYVDWSSYFILQTSSPQPAIVYASSSSVYGLNSKVWAHLDFPISCPVMCYMKFHLDFPISGPFFWGWQDWSPSKSVCCYQGNHTDDKSFLIQSKVMTVQFLSWCAFAVEESRWSFGSYLQSYLWTFNHSIEVCFLLIIFLGIVWEKC